MEVTISVERTRGCGYRSPGAGGVGFYFMGGGEFEPCERLPFPLHVCPTCGQGVKTSRGYTWIEATELLSTEREPRCTAENDDLLHGHNHDACWMCSPQTAGARSGLIWVGEKYYPKPSDFMREARDMGISRKLGSIPDGFEVGKTVIYLAHAKALIDGDGYAPGIFSAYRPSHVDLVIDDPWAIPDKAINVAQKLGAEHCRIVKVIPETADEAVVEFGDF